ncbi:MAG: signal peptidase II [Thermoguttaceae bacterium]
MRFHSTDSEKKGKTVFLSMRMILFVAFMSVPLFADLLSKEWVFRALGMPGEYRFADAPQLHGVYWIVPNVFGLQTGLNEGALFGIGQGRVFLFAIFSVIALIGIVFWMFHSAWKSRFLTITLALIVAGIIGNLFDRLGLHSLRWNGDMEYHQLGEPVYAVRDWILVMIGDYPWPNFNIADSCLVCGAILLITYSLFFDEQNENLERRDEKSGET